MRSSVLTSQQNIASSFASTAIELIPHLGHKLLLALKLRIALLSNQKLFKRFPRRCPFAIAAKSNDFNVLPNNDEVAYHDDGKLLTAPQQKKRAPSTPLKSLLPPPGTVEDEAEDEDYDLFVIYSKYSQLKCFFGEFKFECRCLCLKTKAGKNMSLDQACDCAKRGDVDGLKRLADAGADFFSQDAAGWTPMMYAADNGHYDAVMYLGETLMAGVTPADPNGWTALHLAARNGNVEIAEYLVGNGSYIDNKTHDTQQTPLEIATAAGHQHVVNMLISAMTVEPT